MESKEILCARCIHFGICKHREDYWNIVQAIQTTTAYVEGEYKTALNIEWVRLVEPICIYFSESKTMVTLRSKEEPNGTAV